MKVKYVLGVILIISVIFSIVILFFAPASDNVQKPFYLFSFNGGSKNHLNEPTFALSAANGKIFVSDSGNHRIAVFNERGKFLYEIGGTASKKTLSYPYGLGVLGGERLIIADTMARAIYEFKFNGEYVRNWLADTTNIEPAGVFVTSNQLVYVTDLGGKKILVFSKQGKLIKTVISKSITLSSPQGISVNDDGTFWVADGGNYNVKLIQPDGELKFLFDGGPDWPLSSIKGLAVDKEQRIYVADTLSNTVRVFDQKGNNLASLSSGKTGQKMQFPVGISVDSKGRIYTADQGNNQIQVWTWK